MITAAEGRDEMDKDLISRKAVIRWVKTECNPYGKPTLEFESGKKVIEHLEQMPSAQPTQNNTHNALKSLDCIDRQAAIDALNRHLDTIPVVNNNTMEMIRRSEVMDCREIINGLPSAEVRTEMSSANDTISRQAAIAVADSSDYVGLSVEDVKKVTDEVVKGLKRLPSEQPEQRKGTMLLNLNDNIKVKLTDLGKDIYYHQYDRTNKFVGKEICKPSFPKEDENGYTEFQLWCFMELYGPHMGMTLPNVIQPLDLIIEPERIIEHFEQMPSAHPERMTNRQWIDFLSVQFDISRTSAKEMLHGMMQWKKEDNFKKMFNGGKT